MGIRALPRNLRPQVTIAYLLLRVSDYFEDHPQMSVADKIEALTHWEAVVSGLADPRPDIFAQSPASTQHPDAYAALHVHEIVKAFRSLDEVDRSTLATHIALSTSGMRRWTLKGADFPSEASLDDYMFEVAGRVGVLLTDLFLASSDRIRSREAELRARSVGFGLGLQTTNIIRGLHDDPGRGWHFIPRAFVPEGKSVASLWLSPESGASMAVLDRLVAKARRHLWDGLEYALAIPRRDRGIRLFCVYPLMLAARTVSLCEGNPSVYHEEVKLKRSEVVRLTGSSRQSIWSNRAVRWQFERLSGTQGHRS